MLPDGLTWLQYQMCMTVWDAYDAKELLLPQLSCQKTLNFFSQEHDYLPQSYDLQPCM